MINRGLFKTILSAGFLSLYFGTAADETSSAYSFPVPVGSPDDLGVLKSEPLLRDKAALTGSDLELLRTAWHGLFREDLPVCAYTLASTFSTKEIDDLVQRFTPTTDVEGEWSLISTNGKPPTAADLEAYEPRVNMLYPGADDLSFLLVFVFEVESNHDGLVLTGQIDIPLIEERFGEATGFSNRDPDSEMDQTLEKLVELLQATINIDRTTEAVAKIRWGLTKKFKPAPFVRLSKMEMTHEFEYVDAVNAVVRTHATEHIRASFMVLMRINEQSTHHAFDFHCPEEIQAGFSKELEVETGVDTESILE